MSGGEKKKGLSSKQIMIPVAIILLFLQTFIVVNMVRISRMGQQISATTQRNFSYAQIANELENETNTLVDRARLYVSTGAAQYIEEYFGHREAMQQQDLVTRALMMGNANEEAHAAIEAAVETAGAREEIEIRAMRLCMEAYQTDITAFPELAAVELTTAEAALSPMGRRVVAEEMLLGDEYLQARAVAREYLDSAVRIVSAESSALIIEQSQMLRGYQMLQWLSTGTIIVLICAAAALLITLLVAPLEQGVAQVRKGELLSTERGVSEYRDLAGAYNEQLHRRRMMENYLRRQTQTDALTGLPNRLAFQNYVTDLSWNRAHSSVTVFSLDVNGLKETNDSKGRPSGDALLRSAAEAIRAAFGNGGGQECFRFGGDEFAAFWVDVPQSEIETALKRFEEEQAARDISVSVGYAYAEDLSKTTTEELFAVADKSMYEDKTHYHERETAKESGQEKA